MRSQSPTSLLFALALILGGCAYGLPVPGGDENMNTAFYKSEQDLREHLDDVKPGMTRDEVFAKLGRKETDMTRMERDRIMAALFGSSTVGPDNEQKSPPVDSRFLQSLEGYRFTYMSIARSHGFSSPVRIKTDENGFSYTVTLIFSDGKLLDHPILSGGVVKGSTSRTLFDYVVSGGASSAMSLNR